MPGHSSAVAAERLHLGRHREDLVAEARRHLQPEEPEVRAAGRHLVAGAVVVDLEDEREGLAGAGARGDLGERDGEGALHLGARVRAREAVRVEPPADRRVDEGALRRLP